MLIMEPPSHGFVSSYKGMVIGIGASAGGLEALQSLFSSIPDDTGASFVVIQHLSPDYKSHMSDILRNSTGMSIMTVKEKTVLAPNTVYLLQPGKEMVLSKGILQTHDRESIVNMPINTFFNTMAAEMGPRCIGVVLSGTGSDGAEGIRNVSDAGGLVLVQSPQSARFDGMPREAIATGLVDFILDPAEMADELTRYINSPSSELFRMDPNMEIPFQEILLLLRSETNIDFSLYKQTTIKRRIQRRLNILQISNYTEYLDRLSMDPVELDSLFHDILIGVTGFFRDADAFRSLYENAILPIVSAKSDGDDVRVWVPACATGEEAYTISMLFHEAFDELGIRPNLKIFASDIHKRSLDTASNGMYSNVDGIEEERLERFFSSAEDGIHQVTPRLRQSVVFVRHDVISNPPFTRLDLVSCRNLFIYLKTNVQQRVLASFMFSLRPGGYMIIGSSETPGAIGKEYEEIDARWRIYRRPTDMKKVPKSIMAHMIPSLLSTESEVTSVHSKARPESDLIPVYDALLSEFIPRGILVNSEFRVIHLFGDAGEILHQKSGRISNDLSHMAEGELLVAIKSAVTQSRRDGGIVKLKGVRSNFNVGGSVDVTVMPIVRASMDEHYFITIDANEQRAEPEYTSFRLEDGASDRMMLLEAELQKSREMLQRTVEELEARNEELLSANEEMQSTNEELNSVNEELNSMNEELYSVNTENNERIKILTNLTNDLNNFIRASEVGTIFISQNMTIRNFTPQVRRIFNIIETDIGRPIEHITYKLADDQFLNRIRHVMSTGENNEREVTVAPGVHYLEKVLPYYDDANNIAGAVLTYVDISRLKHSEILFRVLFDQTPIATGFIDGEGRVISMNPAMADILSDPEDVRAGRSIFDYELIPDGFRERIAQGDHVRCDVEIGPASDMILNGIGIEWVSLDLFPIVNGDYDDQNRGYMILIQDITAKMDERTRMKDSLDEKTLMLQEVHHRVKNNLATVNSLLAMQSMSAEDPLVVQTLKEAETRIFVLSTIHEELYRAERLDTINASNFLQKLVQKIVDLFDIEVDVRLQIDEDLNLTDTYAIPLGLAVNELIINSMIHAFSASEDPRIDLSMHLENGAINLILRDNGSGVEEDSMIGASGSLGTRLIKQLITRQLKGMVEHHNDGGLVWNIHVPHDT